MTNREFRGRSERFSLAGRVALISGGSRGIGAAIAEAFAEAGADVAVAGRSSEALSTVADRLEPYPGSVETIQADVGRPEDRDHLIHRVMERFGRLDILVNNAAAKQQRRPLLERDQDVLTGLWETNVRAYLELSIAACRIMKERQWGRIINLSSVTGIKARPGAAEYGVTKAAEIMMTKSFAREMGEYGITVNAIAPILTKTGTATATSYFSTEADRVLQMQAIKRLGEVDDVLGAALLLASDAGSFITGTTIVIDGGATT